jgi:hypothetical protein
MEPVLPPVEASFQPVMLDLQMMQMGGGLRTYKQWEELLGECGLKVNRFWPARSNQTVIEAVWEGSRNVQVVQSVCASDHLL